MQNFTRTLFDRKKNWSANGISRIEIPHDRYISQMLLRFIFTYTSGAAAAIAEDGILNAVKRIDLLVNGTPKRSWAPKRYWYRLPLALHTKPELAEVTTTQAAGKKAKFALPMIFRLDLDNENDFSALLPSRYLDNVELEIHWADNDVLGNDQTITAGELEVTLAEHELTRAEEVELYGVAGSDVVSKASGLLQVVETEQVRTVDAAYDPYQFTMDLPTGGMLTRSYLFAVLNGARSDTLLPQFQVRQDAPTQHTYDESSWDASQSRDRGEYGFPQPIAGDYYLPGFTVLDYVDYGGLDLRGRRTGEVRFRAETLAPNGTTNVTLLHEQVRQMPY